MNSRFTSYTTIVAIAAISFLSSCKKDKVEDRIIPSLAIPSSYDTSSFATNTIDEQSIKSNFGSLVSEIKKARVNGVKVSESTMITKYETGSLSTKNLTTANYNNIVLKAFKDIDSSSSNTYTPSATIPANGGTYGGFLFNRYGLESEQVVDKGLFGAMLYNRILFVISQPLTESSIDKLVVLWGATQKFANQDISTKTTYPDVNIAKYSARRDKNDGNGYYNKAKNELIKAKAAIKAGSDYNAVRDASLNEFKLLVEKSLAATVVNYCIASAAKLNLPSPTSNDFGAAMHAMSENVGFLSGFKGISDKKITDAQIDELLTLMFAPSNGAVAFYKYNTDTFAAKTNIVSIQSKLKAIYGFSDLEMIEFATDHTKNRQ